MTRRPAAARAWAPRAVRRRNTRLDNIALVPASLLPFKDQWEQLAKALPAGEALLVVPTAETPLKGAMRLLVPQLRAKGRHITTLSTEQFS